jgi:phosphoadenosine phosphosulfate reductase
MRADGLSRRLEGSDALTILDVALRREFPGRTALVSSFGAEAAVLLALVAEVEPSTPVVFIDTGKLFGETLRYRDRLAGLLGLTDIRTVEPASTDLRAGDPDGLLWQSAPDACCRIRKVLPLARALEGFDAWITGRKRYQARTRAHLAAFEADGERLKINPIAAWDRARVEAEFERRGLPRHPKEAEGYPSIGCMPCTDRVAPGADPRSGRWAGSAKTECGIHTLTIGRR